LSPAGASAGLGGLSTLGEGIFEVFSEFFAELRAAGVPVSTTEVLDATEALRHLALTERENLKLGLAATLVKQEAHWHTYETLFDLYFSLRVAPADTSPGTAPATSLSSSPPSASELAELAFRALLNGGPEAIAALASAAVARFAGISTGRAVQPGYYAYRTLRQLDVDDLARRLSEAAGQAPGLEGVLLASEYRRRLQHLRQEVEAEVRRHLVNERGSKAMARAVRRPLPEDVDFMHLSRDELAALQRAIQPLSRKLAVHLARRRRNRQGRLDFRATARRSLASGGVPVEPRFRSRRRSRPELWALADISGSVATFSRFTLQLVYALSSQFSRTRVWAFIDGVDEVTEMLRRATDVAEAVRHVNMAADVVWREGHSDYGHVLADFVGKWGRELTPRTTVVVLGDARNNYHPVEAWAMAEVARRARQVFWLNPEPRAYWDTGDSVLAHYGAHCTGVYECRNLRQLRRFIEQLP
jgi:uncharacterized protein with von Willebrand factor type A (vWA) domain